VGVASPTGWLFRPNLIARRAVISVLKKLHEPHHYAIQVAQLAFPYNLYRPTRATEPRDYFTITLSVSSQLWQPKLRPRRRLFRESATRVLMPKTPMNEDHFPS
jgi:hypothetical protein